MTIGIVDVGIGNLGSINQAIYNLGFDSVPIYDSSGLDRVTHLLLPGVGAFNAAMKRLREAKLVEPIRAFAENGKPLLGICLGMQLLATRGCEGGETWGLNLVPGHIEKIDTMGHLRIPHVGWNEARQKNSHPILNRIRNDVDFYFVHSYKFVADDQKNILAVTEYGETFSSIVAYGNIVGIQFHPEKSQTNGIKLLENFCTWDGKC